MEITGKIKLIGEVQTFGANGFQKREMVVTTEDQYPQMIMIEFTQDKCELLNTYQVGENVKVSINLKGREWINPQGEAKYFNAIQGWRIESASTKKIPPPTTDLTTKVGMEQRDEPDDLPF